ncbi:hypothetical protein D7B24_004684 [Verticillium nonalfalfae]|uniref:RING-type domain-containing protein n=1 Tax=Verticillium nonalfalfae TaxID=1051616 RepID=A0A3M9YE36_9PEZI|nr:uncharacterized protein D7B24_004684 [Verticillium nonalfalfae]RNJ58415.1 hypothetical protein D7B24_004684 [Verticillium nonalfalfae]
MEHSLKCNVLKCRQEITDRALVTTCSHIFCINCAGRSGLAGQSERRSSCPACNSNLGNPDDAVIAILSPSEDYKTSVLSGLSPNIIMECAGRALSFWAYQTTQEMWVDARKYLEKTLTDKYKALDMHLDKTVNEANAEIESIQGQLKDLALQNDAMRRKYDELGQAFKDKSRRLLQTQELYDRVKRRAEMGQMQAAACDAVDSHLQMNVFSDTRDKGSPRQGQYEQQADFSQFHKSRGSDRSEMPPPQNRGATQFVVNDELWAGQNTLSGIGMQKAPMITPVRQRTRNTANIGLSAIPGLVAGSPVPLNGPTRMQEFTIREQSAVAGNRESGVGDPSIHSAHLLHPTSSSATPVPRGKHNGSASRAEKIPTDC